MKLPPNYTDGCKSTKVYQTILARIMLTHSELAALAPTEPLHQQEALASSQELLRELSLCLRQLISGDSLKTKDGIINM